MRYAALLLFIGCSAGPSVDVPPPVVVEPVSDAYTLPDADKQNAPVPDSVVAEKPDEPDVQFRIVGDGRLSVIEDGMPRWPTEEEYLERGIRVGKYAVCDCGGDCKCIECPCANCPHRQGSKKPQKVAGIGENRYLAVISADWCGPCRAIHAQHADTPGVRFVDVDRERAEAARLWGGTPIAGRQTPSDGVPAAIPAFVLVVDGEPVRRWTVNGSEPWIEGMRDFEVSGASQRTHDAQPQDAANAGEPPAWCVRIHIDGNGGIGSGSGVVVSPGLVLTNRHVAQVPGRVRVLVNGQWRVGSRRAYAPAGDLALIAVDCRDVSPVPVAAAVSDGDAVATHGYAAGVVYRTQATTFRTDGTVNGDAIEARSCSGESGGPVVNSSGELVGLIYGADVRDNPDGGRGLIVDLPSIRSFLNRQGVL